MSISFASCRTIKDVHVKLLADLCSDYLNEIKCTEYFDRFAMNSRKYLNTPRYKNMSTAKDICDALESIGRIKMGEYGDLKELTTGIDVSIPKYIEEAEETMMTLTSQENKGSKTDISQGESALHRQGRKTKGSEMDICQGESTIHKQRRKTKGRPSKPTLPFRTTKVTDTSVILTWGSCKKSEDSENIVYLIKVYNIDNHHLLDHESENPPYHYEVSQENPDQEVKFDVQALNEGGESPLLRMKRPVQIQDLSELENRLQLGDAACIIQGSYLYLREELIDSEKTDAVIKHLFKHNLISKKRYIFDLRHMDIKKKSMSILKDFIDRKPDRTNCIRFLDTLEHFVVNVTRNVLQQFQSSKEVFEEISPQISWTALYERRHMYINDILRTVDHLYAHRELSTEDHDSIMKETTSVSRGNRLIDLICTNRCEDMFLRIFEFTCNKRHLKHLRELYDDSEKERESIEKNIVEDRRIRSAFPDEIECTTETGSIVVSVTCLSSKAYEQIMEDLKEGNIQNFFHRLLDKNEMIRNSTLNTFQIKLRLSFMPEKIPLPERKNEQTQKQRIFRVGLQYALDRCSCRKILRLLQSLNIGRSITHEIQIRMEKVSNETRRESVYRLLNLLYHRDDFTNENTRQLMKGLVGSEIIDTELQRCAESTGYIIRKHYGTIVNVLDEDMISELEQTAEFFGDKLYHRREHLSVSGNIHVHLLLRDIMKSETLSLDVMNLLIKNDLEHIFESAMDTGDPQHHMQEMEKGKSMFTGEFEIYILLNKKHTEEPIVHQQEDITWSHTLHGELEREMSALVLTRGIQEANITPSDTEAIQDQDIVIECHQEDETRQNESQRQEGSLPENVQPLGDQITEPGIKIRRLDGEMIEKRYQRTQIQMMQDEKPDLNGLKERLVKIPLTPLQEDSDKLPMEQLFASVIIKEDSKKTRKGKKSAQGGKEQERKEVKTPEDMLTKNGKPVRRVYMLGDAAHGKTTYCTWLLKKWCNAQKPSMSGKPLDEWENALSQFDFVFHLKFRHVDPRRANVTDMICQDILGEDTGLHTAAKHVLSSDKYRCLIIMDGLDEWKLHQSAIAQLRYKGMPNIDNMSNCVIFTTMRPWMFADVAELVRDEDRVIVIQGLWDKGIEDVIEKVLVDYYEMKPDSDEYTAKYKEIISKLNDKTLRSFIHVPLLAVVCIQIWCTGEQVGNSLTSFYTAMVNMLIERAKLRVQIQKLSRDTTNLSLPRILSAKKNINCFSNVLLKLGKVAYEGLLSKQMKLVFQKDDLESEISERELQFALDVGLISQREAPSITTRKVNVHFFHKSVQEFLSVFYVVTQKKVSDNFCTRLCNVKVIMELSNVIMFICGMCPSLGSVISQRVVSVTDNDGGICEYRYRETPWGGIITVEELYKLQVSWYRELKYGLAGSPVTDNQVTFHVSDVYLHSNSDTETVMVTRELLSGHHDIRSLYLRRVPTDGESGITETELDGFLSYEDKAGSLVKLYINGGVNSRSLHTLCLPSLRSLSLSEVTIEDRDSEYRPIITQMDRLQRLVLGDMSLGDRSLGLTPHMTDLQKVKLDRVRMKQLGWVRLIQSVIDIHHQFDVKLYNTDIDSDSVLTLHSSPHILVTRDDTSYHVVSDDDSDDDSNDGSDDDSNDDRYAVRYGGRYIEFTRVWPLT